MPCRLYAKPQMHGISGHSVDALDNPLPDPAIFAPPPGAFYPVDESTLIAPLCGMVSEGAVEIGPLFPVGPRLAEGFMSPLGRRQNGVLASLFVANHQSGRERCF